MTNKQKNSARASFWEQVTTMNRGIRLFVVVIFAISATLAVSPLVDAIYLQFFFTPETRILPSLIAMGAGLAIYAFGWIYLVGSAGEVIAITTGLKIYFYVGLFTIIIVVIWMTSLLLASL
jgi:hypothetical protein